MCFTSTTITVLDRAAGLINFVKEIHTIPYIFVLLILQSCILGINNCTFSMIDLLIVPHMCTDIIMRCEIEINTNKGKSSKLQHMMHMMMSHDPYPWWACTCCRAWRCSTHAQQQIQAPPIIWWACQPEVSLYPYASWPS